MGSLIRQSRLLGVVMAASMVLAACAPAAAPAPAPAAPAPAPAAPAAPPATPRPQVIPTPLAPLVNPTPTPARAAAPTATPAAATSAQYGGILTVGHFVAPPHMDIHQVNTAGALWAIGPAYSGILQYNPHKNSEIIPDLAERWEASADAKTFTFFLRKGVKWHDGKPLTADDVVVSINRQAFPDKNTVSPRQSLLNNLTKVEKVDDFTVRMTLKDPQASFIPVIANGYNPVMPKHIIDAKGDMKNDIVGTGPFKLKRYQTGIAVELEKNPDYYVKGLPYLDGVTHFIVADWNTRFAALKAKRILMTNPGTPGLTTDMRVAVEKEMPDKIKTWVHVHLGNIITVMNVNMKPFDDVRVRKAVHLALDRKAGIDVLQQGAGLYGYMMPPGTLGALSQEEIDKWPGYRSPKDADLAEAKKLLADAGYANGFDVKLLNRAGATFAPRGVFQADQLKQLGIRATVDTKEDTSFYADLFGKKYPITTYGEGETIGDPDVYLYQYLHSKGSKNTSGFANAEIDKLIELQSRTLDAKERDKIAQDIQRKVMTDHLPIAHILHLVGQMGAWREVRNYDPPIGLTNNLQFADVWIAK